MEKQAYKQELTIELKNILQYWINNTIDNKQGGFYGSIGNSNEINANADKGIVLNARILWTFSAAYNTIQNETYLLTATRAYQYIAKYFVDKDYGGVYWSVDAAGNMQNGRKQMYGLAFYLYGLSEYYIATKNEQVLEEAIALFNLIEEKSFDSTRKGYLEAFARDWQPQSDLRLSDKDANEKKTMNTHLHIIEAYANLYKVWPNKLLKQRVIQLLEVFDEYMIDKNTAHLILFFNEDWQVKPDVISYGHDIEAAWLLQQCAEIIKDEYWINKMKKYAVPITKAAMRGLDADGGLWYEYEPAHKRMVKEKHWWPQAEAMIGFYNAYQVSGDNIFLQHSINSWQFVKKHILDNENGEWFWGVKEDYTLMQGEDKAGFWKCPYHNGRACLEIIQRIQ